MQPKNILVFVDTSSARPLRRVSECLAYIAAFAAAGGARITLCDVLEQPRDRVAGSDVEARLVELRRRYAEHVLESVSAGLPADVPVVCKVLSGKPLIGITQLVISNKHDLVVCLAAEPSATGIDSTSMHLLRKCPAPVWVMGAAPPRRDANIAVAVDRDIFSASDTPQHMAEQLLNAGSALAGASAGRLHIVHAWEVYGAQWLDEATRELSATEVESYVDSQRYAHTLWLERLHHELEQRAAVARSGALSIERHLLRGNPAEVIPAWLVSERIDLLVLGTLGSSALPGMLIGNTAETILAGIGVPVLALKPVGFRTPLVADERPRDPVTAVLSSA